MQYIIVVPHPGWISHWLIELLVFLVNLQSFVAGLSTGGEEGCWVLDPVVPSTGKMGFSVLPARHLLHVNDTRYRECMVPYLVSKLNREAAEESDLARGRRR